MNPPTYPFEETSFIDGSNTLYNLFFFRKTTLQLVSRGFTRFSDILTDAWVWWFTRKLHLFFSHLTFSFGIFDFSLMFEIFHLLPTLKNSYFLVGRQLNSITFLMHLFILKFMYSEKTPKFEEISFLVLTLLSNVNFLWSFQKPQLYKNWLITYEVQLFW